MPKADFSMKILLDTHVWVWLVSGNPRLKSCSSLGEIQSAAKSQQLYLSAISLWEVAMLVGKKRLLLDTEPLDWLRQALVRSQTTVFALSPEVAVESCRLPAGFHGDPADRIIAACARVHAAKLITHDAEILAYSRAGHLTVEEV